MSIDARQLQDQRKAALLNKWSEFFNWLKGSYGLHLENAEPGKPQHCPVHGGDSGEAFRFFNDFNLTGGGICNSGCIKMSSGDKLVTGWLTKLREASSQAYEKIASDAGALNKDPEGVGAALIDLFLSENGIELPAPRVGLQVCRWIGGIDTRIALKYLSSRGLSFSPNNLPESIRGSKRYWAHPNYKKATGVMGLVFSTDDKPVTHQVIFTNKHCEKLGTRPEDQVTLDLMRDGKPKGPAVKRLASLEQQEDLSFRYVPLGDNASDVLLLGEGIETVLAGRKIYEHVHSKTPGARAMVGSPYMNQVIPDHVNTVLALIDNDHTVERAQEELEFLASEYRDKEFIMMIPEKWSQEDLKREGIADKSIPEKGKDWLDTYVRFSESERSAIWNDGAKKVKATGISRMDIGASTPSASTPSASTPSASNPSAQNCGWNKESRAEASSVIVPVSDNKFFVNLSRSFKRLGFNWMKQGTTGDIFTLADGEYIQLDDEAMIAELAQNFMFYPDMGGSYRNSQKKEIPFPEDRVRRWMKSSSFKKALKDSLKTVRRITPCLNINYANERWSVSNNTNGFNAEGIFVLASHVHLAGYRRACDWIELCERNPELAMIDISLINPSLATHLRTSGMIGNPAALTRVSTMLMLEEVVERFLLASDNGLDVAQFYRAFFKLVSGVPVQGNDTALRVLANILDNEALSIPLALKAGLPSLTSTGQLFSEFEREAILSVLYLSVLGWAKYSASALDPDTDFVEAVCSWSGIDELLSMNKVPSAGERLQAEN